MRVRATAPGRVNLIGDHTDHSGGWVLPMAIDLATTVELDRGGSWVVLDSAEEIEPARIRVDSTVEPAGVRPPWARYVAGVIAATRPREGGSGRVTTGLPVGAGLSSSAALEVAVALALGFEGTPLELAQACRQAEQVASDVPCGIMDQLASAAGVAGSALLVDCTTLDITPVPVPDGVEVIVVDSGTRRRLADSAYGRRQSECQQAEALIGPLRTATEADVAAMDDGDMRRRARHVVSENRRVRDFAAAFGAGDVPGAGRLMGESHASLRDDFAVSTPVLDALVERLTATPGVLGARLTGAGFGGCVVVLAEAGATVDGRRVRPSAGASVTVVPG